jgi:hypothetical protein
VTSGCLVLECCLPAHSAVEDIDAKDASPRVTAGGNLPEREQDAGVEVDGGRDFFQGVLHSMKRIAV